MPNSKSDYSMKAAEEPNQVQIDDFRVRSKNLSECWPWLQPNRAQKKLWKLVLQLLLDNHDLANPDWEKRKHEECNWNWTVRECITFSQTEGGPYFIIAVIATSLQNTNELTCVHLSRYVESVIQNFWGMKMRFLHITLRPSSFSLLDTHFCSLNHSLLS